MIERRNGAALRPLLTLALTLVIGALALSACGSTSTSTPNPNPQPQPTAVKTPQPTGLTVGQLSDQIKQAWAGLKSYRSVFTATQNYAAVKAQLPGLAEQLKPPAGGAPFTDKTSVQVQVTDEVVFPDRKDRLILVNGQPILELMTQNNRLYVRRYTSGDSHFPAAEPWTEIDKAHLSPNDPMFAIVTSFNTVGTAPFASAPGTSRDNPLYAGSTVQVGQRVCHTYQAITTTQTGETIQNSISVGDDHLPCTLVITAGGTSSEYAFSGYNETMALPAVLASPVASPAASPVAPATPAATPGGHD